MRRRTLLLTGGAGLLAGCASAPVHSWQIAAVPGQTLGGTGQKIGIRSIGLPGALGQAGVPEPGSLYAADSFPNDLWAAPLASLLQTAMVQDLAQRLPGDTILATGGAIGAATDRLIEIQVLNFGPDASGTVSLTAQIATRPASAPDFQMVSFTGSAPGGVTAAQIVAAMSTLWGQAADRLASQLALS